MKLAAVLLAFVALAGCASVRRLHVVGPLPTGGALRIVIVTPEVPCWLHGREME